MRLLFLNQYGPPDSPPTARLLGELADHLRSRGHEVNIVSQRESYQGRPARGGGRLKREIAALWAISRAGWNPRGGPPDIVLSLSSPPGLPMVGAILAWRHQARLVHWAMDLYPELALVLGEISPGPVAWTVGAAMRWAYRRAALIVALDADMQTHLQPLCRHPVQVLPPWPAVATERQLAAMTPSEFNDPAPSAIWTWLYSGNLGRAHEWRTLLDAQHLLEERGLPVRLTFQGDGAARTEAMAYATQLGLQRCEWKSYVAEDALLSSLLAARVLIVTQRPETRGLLWPSKLAVLEKLPRPILFIGPVEGAIARHHARREQAGVFAPAKPAAVADWIERQFNSPLNPQTTGVYQSVAQQSCRTLENWLLALT